MSKYRVPMMNKNICLPDGVREVVAVCPENAKEIVNCFNKGYTAGRPIRIHGSQSTLKDLQGLHKEKTEAKNKGNNNVALLAQEAIDSTVNLLQSKMNAVSFGMAKKHIDFLVH